MLEVKAPNPYPTDVKSVFLGGSLTVERDWRDEFVKLFNDYDVALLNPKGDNIKEVADETSEAFVNSVRWVNEALQDADIVLLHFSEDTESPVSLLDLADLCKYKDTYICMDAGFWKKALIESACIEFNVPIFDSLEKASLAIKGRLI